MKVETTVTYDDGETRALAFDLGAKPAHDDMLRVGETIGRAMARALRIFDAHLCGAPTT